MSTNNANGVCPEPTRTVNPGGYPRDMRSVIGFVGDVAIIDQQAPKSDARLLQVLTQLLEAFIRGVIDVKVAELKHFVAMLGGGSDCILEAHDSRGWL